MKREGFSLIELVILLMLIGIVSVTAFVALNPYKGIKLDAGAKKVAADLQYARNLSLSMARWHGVSFEVAPSNTYSVYETTGTVDTVIENPAQVGKSFIINIFNYYSGIRIISVNIGGGNKVEFHPVGTPYNDRTGSALSATGRIVLEYAGVTREVTITPNTGRVDVI